MRKTLTVAETRRDSGTFNAAWDKRSMIRRSEKRLNQFSHHELSKLIHPDYILEQTPQWEETTGVKSKLNRVEQQKKGDPDQTGEGEKT